MSVRVVGLSDTRVSACRYARQRMDGWRREEKGLSVLLLSLFLLVGCIGVVGMLVGLVQ